MSILCCVADEVESLAAARQAALNGSDPSDAIRVVNALLTQLDKLKQHPNVMVLTTSNLTHAIDLAFIDRADIKAFIGPPSLQGRYNMLHSSFCELQRVGIVEEVEGNTVYPSTYNELMLSDCEDMGSSKGVHLGKKLLEVAKACELIIPSHHLCRSFYPSIFGPHPIPPSLLLIPSHHLLLIPSNHLCPSSHHTVSSHPIFTIFSPHPSHRLFSSHFHHLFSSSHPTVSAPHLIPPFSSHFLRLFSSSHPAFPPSHPIPPSLLRIPSHRLFSAHFRHLFSSSHTTMSPLHPIPPSLLIIPFDYSASSSHPTISASHPIPPSLKTSHPTISQNIPSHNLSSSSHPISPSLFIIPAHYLSCSSYPIISAPHPITPSLLIPFPLSFLLIPSHLTISAPHPIPPSLFIPCHQFSSSHAHVLPTAINSPQGPGSCRLVGEGTAASLCASGA
ncbi:unnamed protein product [Closterium sp. NIES-65]|nr:unnamed protein product [Closterium sp. NIES-65]